MGGGGSWVRALHGCADKLGVMGDRVAFGGGRGEGVGLGCDRREGRKEEEEHIRRDFVRMECALRLKL